MDVMLKLKTLEDWSSICLLLQERDNPFNNPCCCRHTLSKITNINSIGRWLQEEILVWQQYLITLICWTKWVIVVMQDEITWTEWTQEITYTSFRHYKWETCILLLWTISSVGGRFADIELQDQRYFSSWLHPRHTLWLYHCLVWECGSLKQKCDSTAKRMNRETSSWDSCHFVVGRKSTTIIITEDFSTEHLCMKQ